MNEDVVYVIMFIGLIMVVMVFSIYILTGDRRACASEEGLLVKEISFWKLKYSTITNTPYQIKITLPACLIGDKVYVNEYITPNYNEKWGWNDWTLYKVNESE